MCPKGPFFVSLFCLTPYNNSCQGESAGTCVKVVDILLQASDSGYGSETSLRKNASMLSLSSATSLTLSSTSSSSFKVEMLYLLFFYV